MEKSPLPLAVEEQPDFIWMLFRVGRVKRTPFWTVVSLIWLILSLCSLIHSGTHAKQVKQIPALECKTVTAEVSGF